MHIEMVDCQKIVDRMMSILGKNINIMNPEGIIIASGDEARIGAFHEAAKIAVITKEEVIIEKENRYKGGKKGINIPIYSDAQVIGVIGITGEPSEVKGYGVIVKELVELMIQENERKKIELYQDQALKNFASELIKERDIGSIDSLRLRTQLVGFELHMERVILVADICNFSSIIKRYNKDTEIHAQEYKQYILDTIYMLSDRQYDLAFNLYEDRFIIFKSTNTDISEFCNRLQRQLNESYNISLYIGIGSTCQDISDYYRSYRIANSVLDIGRRINPSELIYDWRRYKLETLLKSLPIEGRLEYLKNYQQLLEDDKKSENELWQTVKTYFEHGMSIKNTAASMFIHRNTVLYRLNRIKELYGINVMDNYECMLLYIGILLKNLE